MNHICEVVWANHPLNALVSEQGDVDLPNACIAGIPANQLGDAFFHWYLADSVKQIASGVSVEQQAEKLIAIFVNAIHESREMHQLVQYGRNIKLHLYQRDYYDMVTALVKTTIAEGLLPYLRAKCS